MDMQEIGVFVSPLIGILISGLVSWVVARSTADREIKKLKLLWEHENHITLDSQFSEMCRSVSRYSANRRPRDCTHACEEVMAMQSIAENELSEVLMKLYAAISDNNQSKYAIECLLNEAIEVKRKSKITQE